jgi:hypothetical protein
MKNIGAGRNVRPFSMRNDKHGHGAASKSRAVGTAGVDAMSRAINRASPALVETRFTIDRWVFGARRGHEVTGPPGAFIPETRRRRRRPELFFIYPPDRPGWALHANGGMNTTWNEPAAGVFGDGRTAVDPGQAVPRVTDAREMSLWEAVIGWSRSYWNHRLAINKQFPKGGNESAPP